MAVLEVCLAGYAIIVGIDFVSGLIDLWQKSSRVKEEEETVTVQEVQLPEFGSVPLVEEDFEIEVVDIVDFESLFPVENFPIDLYATAEPKEEVNPYAEMKQKQLRLICKERGLKGYTTMTNDAIRELLLESDRTLARV